MSSKFLFTTLFLFMLSLTVGAQDDGMDMLSEIDDAEPEVNYTTASYKTNRIINATSLENTAKGVMDIKISHRFGPVNDGFDTFFGLDNASTRLGAAYGITDWLQVGLGRSTFQKTWDGYLKFKFLRQQTGLRNIPLSIEYLAGMTVDATPANGSDKYVYFSNRMAYAHQLIIGSKISKYFSLQLMPSFVHRNLVETRAEKNDVFAIGVGGRIKVSNRIALTGEYHYVLPDQLADINTNSLSLGIDIETGGHVFQLFLTNSVGINEVAYLTQTTGKWLEGDIRIGFNIARVFTIVKPKEQRLEKKKAKQAKKASKQDS